MTAIEKKGQEKQFGGLEPKLADKTWNAQLELGLHGLWKKEKLFEFDEKSRGEPFVIDTPPPYPSGDWHPGAVAGYVFIDTIARLERARGKNVFFPMGLDRNGINIERTVEKKTGKPMRSFDRAEFIELCRKEIDAYGLSILDVYKRCGASCDFDNVYLTDSSEYRALSQAAFIELWHKGLVYEASALTSYCPGCGTTLADADVVRAEKDSTLNHVLFTVKETGEKIEIATTRPELLCTAAMVIFNPEDARYKKLDGKRAVVPVFDIEVPIRAHPEADPEFGSGLVFMSKSAGDQDAIRFLREVKIEPVMAVTKEGTMNEKAGKFKGLHVKKARAAVLEELKKLGLLKKQEVIKQSVPVCERSKDEIEYIAVPEYYVKQLEFLDRVKKRADKIVFKPEKHKQILLNWVNSLTIDWPISRNRYYHTEIPVWKCKKCKHAMVPKPGPYYQPWKQKTPFAKCERCGHAELVGETKVFETWFDSSISNLFVAGWKRDNAFFKRAFPNSLRPQGRDIVRTWLYYTLLKNELLLSEKPWQVAFVHGMGLDEHGKKMSKSLGNVVDPKKVLDSFGADAFRFWAASETGAGDDFKISIDRIQGAAKFLTKLWNTARFISMFDEKQKPKKLHASDAWILGELNAVVEEAGKGYDDYNFFVPSNRVKDFVWNVYAPHYLEMVKRRAYDGDESALFTLHETLKTLLALLAPVTPHLTDKVFRELYGKTVHVERLPKPGKEKRDEETTLALIEFNSRVWNEKKSKNLPLNSEFKADVPLDLAAFSDDLKKMHRLI